MKFEELFNDNIPDLSEKIAENYSVLSDEKKERIYNRIQRKMTSKQNERTYNDSVSGVEKYRRSIIRKFIGISVSVAAAAVIVVSSVFLHMNRDNMINKNNSVLNSLDPANRPAAAKILADEFLLVSDYLNGEISTNGGERNFFDYSYRDPEWQGEDVNYYMIDDNHFKSCSEIYSTLREAVTSEYFEILKKDGGQCFSKGIDEAVWGKDNIIAPVIVEYNGILYTSSENENNSTVTPSDPEVYDNEKYSFSASVSAEKEYVFDFEWDGMQWKIDDVRTA